MALNDPRKLPEFELPEGSPKEQMLALQKKALEEGIPPARINEYLLEQDWVPEEIKKLLRAEIDAIAAGRPSPEAQGLPAAEQPVTPASPAEVTPEAPQEIKGSVDVGVLDAKEQMKQIKEKYGEAPVEARQEILEKESGEAVEEPAERISQTAENKEQTTTSGTQDTTAGVATRASLGVTGYVFSQQLAANSDDIAEHGNVRESRTWQAAVMRRLREMWGSIREFFSAT